jgi:ADP-heptose:LPS heptosyltransferase
LLFTHRAMWSEHQHRAETALDLAGLTATALGAGDGVSAHRDGTSIKPQLWIQPSELEAARERLLGMGLSLDQPIIGMNTGANRERSAREWAPERFAEAANALAYKMRASVVLLGNGAQRAVGNRVKELLRCPAVNLCGETGLREAFAIASMCRLWLGNDGGLLHVAAAVCPAVVGVFDPYTAMVWGYRLPTCRTVYSSAHEGSAPEPDTKPFTRWAGAALDAVSAEQVTAAGFEVLKASESVAIQAHATRVSSPDGVA